MTSAISVVSFDLTKLLNLQTITEYLFSMNDDNHYLLLSNNKKIKCVHKTYIHTYTYTIKYIHIHTYIHVHTYIHKYIHNHIHKYIHAYLHTYIHT